MFSNQVSAVAQTARQAGVPVVAFSSDAAVAGPGVYLLSFLPSDDVNRIVSYSASQGRKSFAALLPANAYGAVAEAAFRRAVAAAGGRIVSIQTYQTNAADMRAKAAAIASFAPQIDALLMPDAGDVVPATWLPSSRAQGITRDKVRMLGSGQWDDSRASSRTRRWSEAGSRRRVKRVFRAFRASTRRPTASRRRGMPLSPTTRRCSPRASSANTAPSGFQASVLTSPNGFAGIDGIFRFLPSGLTERRFAVYEVTGSGARLIDPAARRFVTAGGT